MYRNSLILLIALLTSVVTLQGQQLAVKSFRSLPHDMDALQNYPLKDQNGEICAIVKVQTLEKGFLFDNGSIGIVKTVQKPGEIWVYMPHGSKRLTITHEHFLPLRDYFFTEPIVEGACYELVLASGRSVTTIVPDEIETQWLIITSDPAGADVFIDDQPAGVTPYQSLLPVGKHTYRLQKPLYQNDAGMVELISGQQKKKIESKLRPNFGTVQVTTTPESGAAVLLNGQETGKTTPCTLERVPAGQHTLSASLNMYATATQQFTMQAGETLPLTVNLKPSFGEVSVNTNPKSDVYVNGQLKGNGLWQGRLNPGIYTFEAKLDKHATATEQRTVAIGERLELTLQPEPRYGTLNVVTNPMDATIRIAGKDYGTTPTTLKNFLIGDYTVELSLPGYATAYEKVIITEGETATVNATLQNRRQVTISSTPTGVNLSIDGQPAGTTPFNGSLTFGNHTLRIEQDGKQAEKQVTISQTGGEFNFSLAFGFETFTETVNGVSFKMVAIKGGSFQMGSNIGEPDEKPIHSVQLNDFYLEETEVTVTQFAAFVMATGYLTDAEKRVDNYGSYTWSKNGWVKKEGVTWLCDATGSRRLKSGYNHPVLHVSWNDASEYCKWLYRVTGKKYRLPTEAEWEFASGNGSKHTLFSWGDGHLISAKRKWANVADDAAQRKYGFPIIKTQPYYEDGFAESSTVAQFPANDFGIYDLAGNVWEWCNDWYNSDYYKSSEPNNPIGSLIGTDKVQRGGSWQVMEKFCRTANRGFAPLSCRQGDLGFRLALTP